jgi:hypothetical protein
MNRKEFTILSIITFLTVIAWIIFSINHTKTSSNLEGVKMIELTPLTPNFDNDIIMSLKNRED